MRANGTALPFGRRGPKPKYPFARMRIGSVRRFAATDGKRARNAASQWARKNGLRFSSTTRGEWVYIRREA